MIKNYLISLLYFISIILIGGIIITLLDYFSILNQNIINILRIILSIISIFTSSFILGKKSLKKGYIEGIKFGIITILLLLMFDLIFSNISIKTIIFFIILVFSSTLGSMIGILKKAST